MIRLLASSLLGTTMTVFSRVRIRVVRVPMVSTSPTSPLSSSMRSPGRKGRSSMIIRPANMLLKVSWAARATARDATPAVATRPVMLMLKCSKMMVRAMK